MIRERNDILDDTIFVTSPNDKEPADKIISWVLRITLSLLLISVVFKVLHWPVPMYFFPGMLLILLVAYTFRFARKRIKTHLDFVKYVYVSLYCVSAVFGEYIYYYLPRNVGYVLGGISLVLLLYILSVQGLAYFNNENKSLKLKRLWQISRFFTFFGFGFFCIAILFKIMHWPGATISILIASLFTIVGILTHIRE